MTPVRRARLVATAAVAAFWVGTVVAGSQFPGYSARDDVVSTLAGRGSPVAVLGIAVILCLALAHAAGARALAGSAARREAWLLLGAAAATVVVAVFRVSNGRPDDGGDLVHAGGVVGYQLLLVATMATVAARGLRGRDWSRPLAVVSAVAAVVSVTLLPRWSGEDGGLWQRLWLGTNLGWLLLATWAARGQDGGPAGGRRRRRRGDRRRPRTPRPRGRWRGGPLGPLRRSSARS